MEFQGIKNWEGLLDPLDDDLRKEILRYGKFVEAAIAALTLTCHHPHKTGYKVVKNLYATCVVQMPRWTKKTFPNLVSPRCRWIGYVVVCDDAKEITRLGRRDIVISFRGFVIQDDIDDVAERGTTHMASMRMPSWLQKCMEDTQWVYAEVGKELRLSSKGDIATCHDLKTYLHLVTLMKNVQL
ncbi:hypothetical protein KY284_020838 [Solanum tuberosum]|nr:hypothetical protein KY284_020838 [Solanum tuberosum]